MVKFREVGTAKEILEVSDQFVQLLRHCFANWLNHVSLSIRKQAEITTTGNQEHLYTKACKNYAAAVSLNPDLHEAFGDWAVTLFHWAKLKEGEEAKRLFDEARSKLIQLTEVEPSDAYYNLACLSSLEGNELDCHEWLEKCLNTDAPRTRNEISVDPDFEHMRDKKWFTAMFTRRGNVNNQFQI
ncbi:MAG: hypothetical protein LC770_02955 [Acidobacteria bacterium]|nr:hypothetical protein [Acidobacteriota bacterium]